MTPEEKAKRYDEALARARKLQENSNGMILKKWLWNIFPELKESEDEKIKKALISILKSDFEEDTKIFGISGVGEIIAWLEKQGKLPIPKLRDINEVVEPKFYEGDWVIYNNDICQIVKREEGCNILVTQFGVEKEPVNERNLSTAKLWDISDARDGDVLVFKNNIGGIIICKSPSDYDTRSYCRLIRDNLINKEESGWNSTLLVPATKEQRDTLFTKMKESGYRFDFEKKELKKLGQSEVTKTSDQEKYSIPSLKDFQEAFELKARQYDIELPNRGYDIHAMCKELYSFLIKQKPAWSEDDEHRVKDAIYFLDTAKKHYASTVELDACIDWLKSLKQRIGG